MEVDDGKDQICISSIKDDEEEEWSVSCSDDEKYCYNPLTKPKGPWEPPAAEIIKLYKVLDEQGILPLEWVCPGRRSPTPPPDETEDTEESDEGDRRKVSEPDAFDFDAAPSDTTFITPRRVTPGSADRQLKGSGQRRIASLSNVVQNIRRHRHLEALESNKTPTKSTQGDTHTTSSGSGGLFSTPTSSATSSNDKDQSLPDTPMKLPDPPLDPYADLDF